jgi:general stress protein 26
VISREPLSIRAIRFPAAYGTPGPSDSLLPWSYVEERLRAAPNYWITTVGPDARPHARPVDGVWVGALCFGGSPETRWVRNLRANPAVSAHLGSEVEAVILEGRAEYVTDADNPLAAPMLAASREKYPRYFSGDDTPFRPFWALRPTTAFAWKLEGFPRGATRWQFERG